MAKGDAFKRFGEYKRSGGTFGRKEYFAEEKKKKEAALKQE